MPALSFNPSYEFSGNDGNWSTFALRIGTPLQTVHVLPSTSGSSTWVVDPRGCDPQYTQCPDLRGGLFNYNDSTSFLNKRGAQNPYFGLNFDPEEPLGYATNATVGLDIIALGNEGNVTGLLDNQVIGVFANPNPLWVGVMGLEVQNETVANSNDRYESPLGRLNSTNTIPSAYWAYTAGAQWLDVYGSLTFGGYDSMRGDIGSAQEFSFGGDQRNFLIEIADISIASPGAPVTAGGLPITAFIDSVVPEIWLPLLACQAFEAAFNLTWNEQYGMYLVDDEQHSMLVAADRNVTFTLVDDPTAKTFTSTRIVLPYSAFDLTATFPLAGIQNATGAQRYFPLKRASNDQQYYLGRTFLQSAYMAVNYETQHFAITQAFYPDRDVRNIVTVNRSTSNKGLSAGAIAGIAIGAAAAVALLGVLIFFFWRKKKNQKKKSKHSTDGTPSIGGTTIEGWADGVTSQEYFDPKNADGETEDQFKPELDATATARAPPSFYQRHELSAGASVRRTSQQSGLSRGSGVSPMVEQRASSHLGHCSMSSFGQPSPGSPGSPREMSAIMSPTSGPITPPPLFSYELPGDSRPRDAATVLPDAPEVLQQGSSLPVDSGDELFLPPRNVSPVREGNGPSRFREDVTESGVRLSGDRGAS